MNIMKMHSKERYSDNDEPIEIHSREDAIEAIKRIELLKYDVESLRNVFMNLEWNLLKE